MTSPTGRTGHDQMASGDMPGADRRIWPGDDPASSADQPGPGARWPEIQSMFVDDPRASVELAAGLTDDGVEALIGSLKERQHALLSAWQGSAAGTEDLRTALQGYRTFWKRLQDFSAQS